MVDIFYSLEEPCTGRKPGVNSKQNMNSEMTCQGASPTIKKVLLYSRIIKEFYAFLSKVSVKIKPI